MPESYPFPVALSLEQARDLMIAQAAIKPLPIETIALDQALNRVLAGDIDAPRDVPGFANSAMDGFALRGADLPRVGERDFRLLGELLAGDAARWSVGAGECVRITTGAALPDGADTVVIKEVARVEGDRVWIGTDITPGANTRAADDDYRRGDRALDRGTRLRAAHLGVLASFGFDRVEAVRRIRAVLLTTGNELIAPGNALQAGQIYNSNSYSIAAQLHAYGVDLLRHEHIRDDRAATELALLRAGEDADIVLTSGGVSVGEADFMLAALQNIGKVHLWKVRMKPGMPFLFGSVGKALAFCLPGNPVSGIATFLALVRPTLDTLSGCAQVGIRPWRARLQNSIRKTHTRAEFQRANLRCAEDGVLWAQTLPRQGSGVLRSVAEADALVLLPEEAREYVGGEIVEVLLLQD